MAVAYIVASWALAQGTAQVLPVFDIPNSVVRWVIGAMMLGFPIALFLAWIYEFTPEGLVREEHVDPVARKSAGRMALVSAQPSMLSMRWSHHHQGRRRRDTPLHWTHAAFANRGRSTPSRR